MCCFVLEISHCRRARGTWSATSATHASFGYERLSIQRFLLSQGSRFLELRAPNSVPTALPKPEVSMILYGIYIHIYMVFHICYIVYMLHSIQSLISNNSVTCPLPLPTWVPRTALLCRHFSLEYHNEIYSK